MAYKTIYDFAVYFPMNIDLKRTIYRQYCLSFLSRDTPTAIPPHLPFLLSRKHVTIKYDVRKT